MRREHRVGGHLIAGRHAVTVAELIGAVVIALVVAAVGLKAIAAVDWPAFNSSNVDSALTTTGQCISIAILVIAVVCDRRGWWRWAVKPLSWIGIAGFATVTLAMPLGATKLYLFGISVDQQFRTEYLTRLTDSPHLADMTYVGLPPYYPAGWFWLGGRYASVAGQAGWEAFKPWAIISIAVAAAVSMVLWTRMIRTDRAIAVSLATTAVTLIYASPEPYGAVLIMIGTPMLVVIFHALRSGSRAGILASGLFIGLSATFYTLFTGYYALTAVLMTLWLAVLAWRRAADPSAHRAAVRARRFRDLLRLVGRLVVIAVIAGLVALIVWAPYLAKKLSGAPSGGGTAEHYLPSSGSVLPFPMLHWSLVGLLCMVGFIWTLLRFGRRTVATALGIAVVTVYLFCLLSMAATAAGSTLLAFRLEPVLAVVLAAAGIFGVTELAVALVGRFGDIRTAIAVVGIALAIAVSQSIPSSLSSEISIAYTDTDGNGVRADKRPPGAESYFGQIDKTIREQTHAPANRSVVLTADYGFLSIYPYWGFQGLTSHYANPLAQFDKRAEAIEKWSHATTPDDLIDQLNHSAWEAPNVFLFRYSADGYTLRLARDVYPNDPNVQRYTVTFPADLFTDPRFTVTEVGPFVVVVRTGERFLTPA